MKNRLLIGASDKTALLLHFIQQDFPTGLTIVDPDGSLARASLDIIPARFTEDVIYFDPSDDTHVASFNPFKGVKDKAKLVQDLCAFFDALFPAGAETLTRLNSNFVLANVLTVITDTPGVSFSSVLEFLSDTDFRKRCLAACTNRMALRNWKAIEGWDKTQQKNAFAQIEAKLGTLLLSPVIHRTLEGSPTFYPTKTSIFIANLSRAAIGDEASKLLGTLLISRAKTPVYINDFGFYASDYIASLFSQGGYTVALQFLRQVPPNVADELLGFPEQYIFRTTPDDAEHLKFGTRFTEARNLVELKEGEFEPDIDLIMPEVTGRSRAVLKRSIARHTRKRENA
jgi:hypothetical protein